MDELPVDLKDFLLKHPFLQLTDGKKVSRLQMHFVMLAVLLKFLLGNEQQCCQWLLVLMPRWAKLRE